MPDDKKITAFISYTHDNEDHSKNVLDLADKLNKQGIDCWIDSYIEDSTPERGWPSWMEEKIRTSDFVLVVSSKIYLKRYEGREVSGVGLGGKFESNLIVQAVYDNDFKFGKFIPILFGKEDKQYTITPLKPATYYNLNEETEYFKLYKRITGQIKVKKPIVGNIINFLDEGAEGTNTVINNGATEEWVDNVEKHSELIPEIPQIIKDMKPGLKIVQAFFNLAVIKRFEIAESLGLLEEGESFKSPDTNKISINILLRAKAKQLMAQLWEKLFDVTVDPNPFK